MLLRRDTSNQEAWQPLRNLGQLMSSLCALFSHWWSEDGNSIDLVGLWQGLNELTFADHLGRTVLGPGKHYLKATYYNLQVSEPLSASTAHPPLRPDPLLAELYVRHVRGALLSLFWGGCLPTSNHLQPCLPVPIFRSHLLTACAEEPLKVMLLGAGRAIFSPNCEAMFQDLSLFTLWVSSLPLQAPSQERIRQ